MLRARWRTDRVGVLALCGMALVGEALIFGAGRVEAQALGAQGRTEECDFQSFRTLQSVAFGVARTLFASLPDVVCADGLRIRADSAVHYESAGRFEFLGGFRYEEPGRTLTADDADYFEREGRLMARGGVELEENGGETLIRGDDLQLYEQGEGPQDDALTVNGTPAFARFATADSTGGAEPVSPYEVYGAYLRFDGDRYFFADLNVEVHRDSLDATAQSLFFDRNAGSLILSDLTDQAHMQTGEAEFAGDSIELVLPEDELTGVNLRGMGTLTSNNLDVSADEIRIDLVEGEIEHLVAVLRSRRAVPQPPSFVDGGQPGAAPPADPTQAGDPSTAADPGNPPTGVQPEPEGDEPEVEKGRPHALNEDFEITADSLDVRAPGGVLEVVYAVGRGRAVSHSSTATGGGTLPDVAETTDDPEDAPGDGAATADGPAEAPGDSAAVNGRDLAAETAATLESRDIDPSILANDWIEGDTIIATFSPAPDRVGADPTEDEPGSAYVLDRLVAIGNARSLYRSPPEEEDGAEEARVPDRSEWSINYTVAKRITLNLVDGRVEGAQADSAVVGYYGEPLLTPAQPDAPADSVTDPGVDR